MMCINCVFCSRAGCTMETPGRNETGNRSSSVIGEDDTGERCGGSVGSSFMRYSKNSY
jgi:hypothetical protein